MKKQYIYVALATILFSTMEIALKYIAGEFNPIQLTFARFFVGGLVLLPFAWSQLKKHGDKLTKKVVAHFALLGFLGVFISMTFYQLAVFNTKASVVAVLFSSNPLFVLLLAYLLLREPITKHQVAALALDILGILIIINPFNTKLSPLGVLFTMLATIFFSLYGVMGKRRCKEYGGLVVTCFSFLLGSLELGLVIALGNWAPVAAFLQGHGLSVFANVPFLQGYTLANLPIALYIFIAVTGIGYTAYFKAMESSAGTASLVFFFKPALAPLLAFLILGENIPLEMLIGILLILAGSLISLLPALTAGRKAQKAGH